MKISKKTMAILKNFSTINQSIVIKPGNVLETISDVKDIFAKVEVEETFPVQVSIYDLNEFLGVLGLFEDPEIDFGETCAVVTEGRQKQVYYYADASIITQPPEKGVSLPSVEVNANLQRETLSTTLRAASINGASHVSFKNQDLLIHNKNQPNSNNFVIEGVSQQEGDYELSVAVEKMKMVQDDYQIEICSKGLARFSGGQGIEYFVALTTDGYYNN